MDECVVLKATLDPGVTMQGHLVSANVLHGAAVAGARYGDGLPDYDGPYDVIPKVEAQSLPTAERSMHRDVQISGVPIFETSNQAGGKTVYIAHDAEMEVM